MRSSFSWSHSPELRNCWNLTKLLVLGLTVHCWGNFYLWDLQIKVWGIVQKRKFWESQNCFLLIVTGFSKLVDYWKSLVLDNYWAKHFLVYTLPQFFTQPNLGFTKERNEVILSWMCKAVLPFHLKYKLMIWDEGQQARKHWKCNVS